MNLHAAHDFDKIVHDSDLLPSWRALKHAIGDRTKWGKFSKFAAFCSSLGVDVAQANEDCATLFLAAFALSGRTHGDKILREMRALIEQPGGENGALALPSLTPPARRFCPCNWDDATADQRAAFSRLVAACRKTGASPVISWASDKAIIFAYSFSERVKDEDFLPSWLALKAAIGDVHEWAKFTQFGAYCSSLGVNVAQAGEEWAQLFIFAFQASGRGYGELRVGVMRNFIDRRGGDHAPLALPPLDPSAKRDAPRKEQWRQTPPELRGDISRLIALCGEEDVSPSPSETEEEAEQKRRASKDEKQRFLLRMVELAATRTKRPITRLRELFADITLNALDAANYGDFDPDAPDRPWQQSTTAIHTRSRLLELGRRYAYDVIADEELGDALDGYIKDADELEKRRATLSAKDRDASRQIDKPENSHALVIAARDGCAAFFARPKAKGAYEAAQSAIAVLLLLSTGRPPFKGLARGLRRAYVEDAVGWRAPSPSYCPTPPLVNLES